MSSNVLELEILKLYLEMLVNVLKCSGNFRNVQESLEMFSNVLKHSGTGNTQCYIVEVSVSESI